MFTSGFLLVDDEVIAVRVESADNGDLYEIDNKDGKGSHPVRKVQFF